MGHYISGNENGTQNSDSALAKSRSWPTYINDIGGLNKPPNVIKKGGVMRAFRRIHVKEKSQKQVC